MTDKQINVLNILKLLYEKHNCPISASLVGLEMGSCYARAIKTSSSTLEFLVKDNYAQKTETGKYMPL